MKASDYFVERTREAIEAFDKDYNRQDYREGRFARAELCKDVDKRYRWDLFWAANRTTDPKLTDIASAEDLTDKHIDTVLKKLVKPL